MATLRIYLKKDSVTFGEWKDGKKCAYNGLYVNDVETISPYVGCSNFNPLNLGYEGSIIEMMRSVKADDIARITTEVKNDWVAARFQKDGETFTHGDALCVVKAWVWRNGKHGPENNVSLEIVGKSLSSIICLIRKMKNGTAHSEEQVLARLKNENNDLRHKLKEQDQELGAAKAFLLGVEGRFKDYDSIKKERDDHAKIGNDLARQLAFQKKFFWQRWSKQFQVWYLNRWFPLPAGKRYVHKHFN